MDSNILLVIGVDGGLILFFLYALYVVNQYPSSGKLKVSAKVKPERTFAITQLEPDLSSIARVQSEPIPEPEPEPIPDLSSFLEPEPEPKQEEKPRHEELSKRNIRIMDIEGIGYVYSEKLKEAGILYVHELLDVGASREGRENLAEMIGVSHNLILEWVNLAVNVQSARVKLFDNSFTPQARAHRV